MFKTIIALAVVLVSGFIAPLHASAETAGPVDGLNLTTSPLPVSLSGVPGSTLTTDLRIKNNNPLTEKLKVTLMKFSAYGEEGKPAIADREEGDTYFDWVKFTPSVFDAPPNEWKSIKMTITLPKTAAFGYYYAAAFSRATIQTPASRQNVILGSTAVLVLVEAKVGNVKREAAISQFTATKSMYEFLPAKFTVKLRNTGNIHMVPSGAVIIKQGKKQIASLKVNSGQGNILPGTNRIVTTEWNDGYPFYKEKETNGKVVLDEKGQIQYKLDWDLSKIQKLRIGRYTAQLFMVYDDGTRDVPLEATVSFWVIPWRLLGVGLVVALFVGIGLWVSGRNVIRKIRKR